MKVLNEDEVEREEEGQQEPKIFLMNKEVGMRLQKKS